MSRTYKQSYNPWTRLTRESMRELQKKKGTQKSNGRLYRYIQTKLTGDDISQNEIKLASNE